VLTFERINGPLIDDAIIDTGRMKKMCQRWRFMKVKPKASGAKMAGKNRIMATNSAKSSIGVTTLPIFN
jgi:hypothetical protein